MKVGTLLVIGARKKSIGHGVAKMWEDMFDGAAVTAGVSGEEDHTLSLEDPEEVDNLIEMVEPSRILCTIGVNEPWEDNTISIEEWLDWHFHVNVSLPIRVLTQWLDLGSPPGAQYVVMSSNSAHIPRSGSMAYCASKAALSMAVRCAARDLQKAKIDMSVYGWEPGLVKGTPMSGERSGTRMLGLPEGISRRALAHQIVSPMAFGGAEYSGTLIRLDNGEI